MRDIYIFYLSVNNLKTMKKRMQHPLSPQLSDKILFYIFFFFFLQIQTRLQTQQCDNHISVIRDFYPNSGWFTTSLTGGRREGKGRVVFERNNLADVSTDQ